MKATVYEEPGKVVLKDVPKPLVKSNDILIKVKAVGICGSDPEIIHGKHFGVVPPLIPGHEVSGEVAEIGGQVKGFQTGDRVVVEPIISCGECRNCATGRHNICRNLKFMGVHTDGAFAEFLAAPAGRVYKFPEKLSYDEAAVLELTAAAVHMTSRAQISLGETVVILGAGPIGLQIAQVARKRGANYIIMTDLLDHRLELAKELAADLTINPNTEDVFKTVNQFTDGEGADVVIEAVGASKTILQTMDLVRVGGRILIVGLSVEKFVTEPPTFWSKQLEKEVTIETSRSYAAGNWADAIKLASRGDINLKALVTHKFPLGEARKAFEVVDKKLDNCVKVLLIP